MSANASINVDIRQYHKALVQYAVASRKTFAEVSNKKAKDLALTTARFLPKASRPDITALGSKEWWPKCIASLIRNEGMSWTSGRKTVKQHNVKGKYTVAQARQVSRRILAGRGRSTTFMRSGFIKAAQGFPGEQKARAKSQLTLSRGRAKRARQSKPRADFIVTYIAPRGARDARNKEVIAIRALRMALRFQIEDMKKYTVRKLNEAARPHNARR